MASSKLKYNEIEVEGIDPSTYVECSTYIKEKIIPETLRSAGWNNASETSVGAIISYSKNSNIKQCVDQLAAITADTFVLVAYGVHVQKALSIIEIFKTTENGKALHQFNKLDSFIEIKAGRNELLDRKVNLPILITLFTKQEVKSLNKFTKQS
ncbi:ribonuclease P/MRP protein subunit POP6 [Kluyveromyces lactis]|uniref:KLLA0B05973p n=1 Tax=Kluyveromyces lactis (strain ATCC 8585 / CBS 2359 / DSM 70799 / NBRC 1267 / NRRL Y-1140 / WM37) TaxID=284590 RepID=Q6CW86_KLULA|nr:uncharacterized protein KLLA0_B05973g [Kluyveromyces lactis]CAH02196.1 KLLA0B05973p [Kluyveromyces lactis]|eukprot:XP_451803.1 uncharacterized protein KLLA0_B05973g [Kluyveromyces lactis]